MIKVQMKHRLRMDLHKTSSPHISIARLFWISSGNWNNFFIFKSAKLSAGRTVKVENILKGSLDLIPSPSSSVKIQIMAGKVCLRCKGKTLLGVVNKLLKTKSLLTSPSNAMFCLITSSKLSRKQFQFSLKLKVMGSNPGYLLISFLL